MQYVNLQVVLECPRTTVSTPVRSFCDQTGTGCRETTLSGYSTCLGDDVFRGCSRIAVQDSGGGFYSLPAGAASPRPPSPSAEPPSLARERMPDDHVLPATLRSDEDERLSVFDPRFYHAQRALWRGGCKSKSDSACPWRFSVGRYSYLVYGVGVARRGEEICTYTNQ